MRREQPPQTTLPPPHPFWQLSSQLPIDHSASVARVVTATSLLWTKWLPEKPNRYQDHQQAHGSISVYTSIVSSTVWCEEGPIASNAFLILQSSACTCNIQHTKGWISGVNIGLIQDTQPALYPQGMYP